jgi:hypothetical protein
MSRRLMLVGSLLAVAAIAPSQVAGQQYSLFRPVPAAQMRDMSTDRPDKTEAPYTVDAGHIQVELDAVNWARSTRDGATETGWGLASINAKVGVTTWADLQLLAEPVVGSRVTVNGVGVSESGSGAFGARFKMNLFGNDDGRVAVAVMPFAVSVPGEAGRVADFGVILPVAVDLGGEWGFGAMAEFDFLSGAPGDARETRFVATATVSRGLTERFGMYTEISSDAGTAPWVGSFDVGATMAFGPNVQLDGGVNLGLSQASDAVNPFLGFTFRF